MFLLVYFTGPTTLAYNVVSTHATLADAQAAHATAYRAAEPGDAGNYGIVDVPPTRRYHVVVRRTGYPDVRMTDRPEAHADAMRILGKLLPNERRGGDGRAMLVEVA